MQSRDRLPFDLWSLQVFLTVCEMRTMAQAAAVLGLTQPAVSQIIQDVERHLGVELFDRTMRPMELTPAGTALRRSASTLVADARQIAPLVQKSRRGYLPLIRVGLIFSLGRVLSVPMVKVLSAVADEVIVLNDLTAAHAAALLTRQIDMLIGIDDLTEETGLDRWPIVWEPYLLLTPKGAATNDLGSVAQSLPFIRYSSRSLTGPEIDRYLRRGGFDLARGAEFDTPYGLTAMVAAGLGWAISTPLCLIEAGIDLHDLDVRPLPDKQFGRTITLVSRRKELGTAPHDVAAASILELERQCRQAFAGEWSWIAQGMRFGAPKASDAVSSVRSA